MAQGDWQSEMRKGVAEMYVLSALTKEPAYGYNIMKVLDAFQTLKMKESTLYLILARLERENLVTVEKRASDKGPKRKYFSLTPDGWKRLESMEFFWRSFSEDVAQYLARDNSDEQT
jgi:PadR family transcriptional regulator PadR